MSTNNQKSMEEWIEEIVECKTYQSFMNTLMKMRKEICVNNDMLTLILFKYVWKDVSSEMRFNVMMDYVSNQPFSFAEPYWFVYSLCSIYDPDKVYDAYEYKVTSPQNNRRRKKMLAAFVSDLKNGLLDFEMQTGYNSRLDYYYISKKECGTRSKNKNDYHMEHRIIRYFKTFEEFVLAMNRDLTDCNLRDAPIAQEDLKLCYVDKTTKLPLSFYETKKQVKKYYDPIDERFVVRSEILDADGQIQDVEEEQSFETLSEFVAFLNGDLSNANLMFYENLNDVAFFPHVKLTGAKLSSDLYRKLKMSYKPWVSKATHDDINPATLENERSSEEIVQIEDEKSIHGVDENMDSEEFYLEGVFVHYVSDIHLDFKIKEGWAKEDVCRYIMKIAKTIEEESTKSVYSVVVIAGDTSMDVDLFGCFVRYLKKLNINTIFTLGNHELRKWGRCPLQSIKREFERIIDGDNMYLLHNDLCYLKDDFCLYKISAEDLRDKDVLELQEEIMDANTIFWGGLGFDNNQSQDTDWYNGVISPEQSIEEAKTFERLYQKVCQVARGKQLVVCSHMPKHVWQRVPRTYDDPQNVVFINGHTHKNEVYDDGGIRIFADNQIGYEKKEVHLKSIRLDKTSDLFFECNDGVYEISIDKYESFMRGKCLYITPDRRLICPPIYMMKKCGYYLFMFRNKKKELLILEGGKAKKVAENNIEYYWNNMMDQVRHFDKTLEYREYQKAIAKEVMSFGGDGRIHGCIIDIDFLSHLYIVPSADENYPIVPYFAEDIKRRKVFGPENGEDGLARLLRGYTDLCPKYLAMKKNQKQNALILNDNNLASKKYCDEFRENGAYFYAASRLMNKLKRLEKGVLQAWDDGVIQKLNQGDTKDKMG